MSTAVPQAARGTPQVIIVAGDDLLFSSQIAASLAALGYQPLIAGTADAFSTSLAQSPAAAILNLASHRFDAIAAIRTAKSAPATQSVRLLGFCGHADVARQRAAQAAGCDFVATNGEVAGHLPRLLTRLLAVSQVPPTPDR